MHEALRVEKHSPPGRLGRLEAEPQKRQRRLRQDRERQRQRGLHNHGTSDIRQDVTPEDEKFPDPSVRETATNGSMRTLSVLARATLANIGV